jgi:hypothetical protein
MYFDLKRKMFVREFYGNGHLKEEHRISCSWNKGGKMVGM